MSDKLLIRPQALSQKFFQACEIGDVSIRWHHNPYISGIIVTQYSRNTTAAGNLHQKAKNSWVCKMDVKNKRACSITGKSWCAAHPHTYIAPVNAATSKALKRPMVLNVEKPILFNVEQLILSIVQQKILLNVWTDSFRCWNNRLKLADIKHC